MVSISTAQAVSRSAKSSFFSSTLPAALLPLISMEAGLSRGAVAAVWEASEDGAHAVEERQAVLQVLGLEHQSLPVCWTPRRWMVLSDGVRSVRGGIPASMDHLVVDGDLRPGTVLRLLEYHCVTSHQGIRIFIFAKFQILQTDCTQLEHGQDIGLSSTALRPAEKSANLTYAEHYGRHIEAGRVRTFAQINADNLVRSDYPAQFIVVKATPTCINKESICYTACPLVVEGTQCCMEISRNGDGWWYCHSCNQTFASCDYKYRILIQLQDPTGMIYAPALQVAGENLFGHTAKELYLMKYEHRDFAQFDSIIGGVLIHDFLFDLWLEFGAIHDKKFPKCTILRAAKANKFKESSGSIAVCRTSVGSRIGSSYLEARQKVQNFGRDRCAMNNRGALDLGRVWLHSTGSQATSCGSRGKKHHAWLLPKVWLPKRFSSVLCLWRVCRQFLMPHSQRLRTYGIAGCDQHPKMLLDSQAASNSL